MNHNASQFTFAGYEEDVQKGYVRFHYKLSSEDYNYDFTEAFSFPALSDEETRRIPKSLLTNILDALHIALGISYWKTFCPKNIILTSLTLSESQANFWNTFYTKGLGEFYYKNSVDYRSLVSFPFAHSSLQNSIIPHIVTSDRSLLLLGAGKDSIVSSELLKDYNEDFTLFSLNDWQVTKAVAEKIGKPLVTINRSIDPKLLELNKMNSIFNGHIPITAIFSLTALFAAILYDFRFVIASNEKSASYGNVEYLGSEINHQWSKSFEFEIMLHDYIHRYVTSDIEYFSLLRPLTELRIAQLFSKYENYFDVFTSCNRNFKIVEKDRTIGWCGECPKCAFVFLLLAACISKEKLLGIFHKNLFSSENLLHTYKELCGIEGFKPFECVGTPEESLYAFMKVITEGKFSDDYIIRQLSDTVKLRYTEGHIAAETLLSTSHEHNIPKKFVPILSTI